MELIVILVLFLLISLLWFFLKVTVIVSVADPKFTTKAFAAGLGSSALGYVTDGHVAIKLVIWGAGGFILFTVYKYFFNRA